MSQKIRGLTFTFQLLMPEGIANTIIGHLNLVRHSAGTERQPERNPFCLRSHYNGQMEMNLKDTINSAAHKDLVLLIKEYAHTGYELCPNQTNGEFERLWGETFRITESESVIPAK